MPAGLAFSSGTIYAFLLVLARIGGAFVLVPFPGMSTGTEIPRVVASIAITIALMPLWPHFDAFPESIAAVVLAVLCEAAFGLSIGLAVACLNEMLKMAAQVMSQQAGFGYASTIDPNTNADAGLLVMAAQFIGGLLFFALGLDREVIRIFASSLSVHPPGAFTGAFHADAQLAEALFRFAGNIFSVGVRLALPSIALLGLIDISLALLGRINAQLQLISISFPLKMLTALALVALLVALYPRLYRSEALQMLEISRHAAGLVNGGR